MSNGGYDFDVGIIGGGPAGSSMASYLAKAGVSCAVFEKEIFPRPHVGESLVPAANRVLKEIGFIDKMDEHGFPRKFGAVWTSGAGSTRPFQHDWEGLKPSDEASIRFEERKMNDNVEGEFTWHVDRGKFDLLLLQHANQFGAKVYEGIGIRHAEFSDSGVKIHFPLGRKESHVTCRLVIDASGRKTVLGNQLGLRVRDDVFDQFAVHTWFDGFDRAAVAKGQLADYIFIHFLPITNSWVWQIPITDTITSLGVVTQRKYFAKNKADREQLFWDSAASRPELFQHLKQSKQMRPFTEEGDYSYAMKQMCGDRFVLIGDAGRFVDPIFSSGVSIAMNGARMASYDVLKALETGDLSRQSFNTYETTLRRGVRNWYKFITMYYRLNVLFTAYVNNPKYRIDVLKLLQGEVYDEEQPEVLRQMEQTVKAVEENKDHLWHSALGDLTANAFVTAL